ICTQASELKSTHSSAVNLTSLEPKGPQPASVASVKTQPGECLGRISPLPDAATQVRLNVRQCRQFQNDGEHGDAQSRDQLASHWLAIASNGELLGWLPHRLATRRTG